MKKVFKTVDRISEGLCYASSFVTFAMMIFMVVDIILRYIFNSPITGDYELIELAMVVLVFTVIPHTQTVKGHVAVDIITNFLPKKVKDIFDLFIYVVCTVFMVIVCKANFLQISKTMESSLETGTLHIPLWPFYAFVFVCLCIYTLIMVFDFLAAAIDLFSKDNGEEAEA